MLVDQRVKTHSTSKREPDDLRDVIERDLAAAAIAALSADRRFVTAYNAALQTATMAKDSKEGRGDPAPTQAR